MEEGSAAMEEGSAALEEDSAAMEEGSAASATAPAATGAGGAAMEANSGTSELDGAAKGASSAAEQAPRAAKVASGAAKQAPRTAKQTGGMLTEAICPASEKGGTGTEAPHAAKQVVGVPRTQHQLSEGSAGMDPTQYNVGEVSQFPPGFQLIARNARMMNRSTYVPQCFQPVELLATSKLNSEAHVKEVASPPTSTGKKSKSSGTRIKLSNFTPGEDVNLVKSWLEITCDPITCTGQKRDRMWERILGLYNLRRGSNPERSVRSLQSRWDTIKAEVGLFARYYADSIRENPSGVSNACKTTHAVANFASALKRKFALLHCWELMKDEPKWQDPHLRDSATAVQGEGFGDDTTKGPDAMDNEDGQSSPVRSRAQARRPMGRDLAKAAKKKANSDAGSTSSSEYAARMQDLSLQNISIMQEEAVRKNDRFQQLASIDEKRFEEMRRHNEQLLQIELEKIRLMREKQEDERIKAEKKEDERILAVDLDACTPPLRMYYQALQEEILEKIASRRQRSKAS